MTNTLKITGYVGGSYADVLDYVRTEGAAALQSAADAAIDRVTRFEERADSPAHFRAHAAETDGSVVLTLEADSGDLDGATVALAPVGAAHSGLTEMAVRLAVPFRSGADGSRQFLVASTFVSQGAVDLTDRLRRAA